MVNVKYLVALLIAGFLDIADYVSFAWLPIVGDFLDIVGFFLLLFFVGKYAFISCLELIPFMDFIPFHIVAVVLGRRKLLGGASK